MKLAILSDIHGNDVAFEAVVKDMEEQHVNGVVFLGDLVAKGPMPMECYQRMVALKPLVWLKGNTEYWLDDAMIDVMPTSPENIQLLAYYDYMVKHMDGASMDHLIGLTHKKPLKLGHFEGLCCHGSPRNPNESLDPMEVNGDAVSRLAGYDGVFALAGHSHRAFDSMIHGLRVVNPGSVGVPGFGEEGIASYAVMDAGSSFKVTFRKVAYDSGLLEQIKRERHFPENNRNHSKSA